MNDTRNKAQQPESVAKRAKEKLDLQKGRVADMSATDVDRTAHEKVLHAMNYNAFTTAFNDALWSEDETNG